MGLKRSAKAVWRGDLQTGDGHTSTQSNVLKQTPYSFKTRFEEDRNGTNPEELIASASASCFTMAFSKMLSDSGHKPAELRTEATLTLEKTESGFKLSKIHLDTTGRVEGIDEQTFRQTAEKAKDGCPVSKLLKPGLDELTLNARLER
jgi:osmotically inducible protein OsmC